MTKAYFLSGIIFIVSAVNALAGEFAYKVAGVRQDDVLNVRTDASPQSSIVGIIPPNAAFIQVKGCLNSWCEVYWAPTTDQRFHAVHGWVQSRYLVVDRYCESECMQ
jgi:uncharacterized protein YraI